MGEIFLAGKLKEKWDSQQKDLEGTDSPGKNGVRPEWLDRWAKEGLFSQRRAASYALHLEQKIEALESKRACLKVQLDGANERCQMLLQAKDVWMEKCKALESELAALKNLYPWDGK